MVCCQALKILDDEMQSDIIKIGGQVANKVSECDEVSYQHLGYANCVVRNALWVKSLSDPIERTVLGLPFLHHHHETRASVQLRMCSRPRGLQLEDRARGAP